MLRFANTEYLYLLLVVPLLVVAYYLTAARRKRVMARFGSESALVRLMPDRSSGKQGLKFWFFVLAFAMMTLAVARPQKGAKLREVEREGVEIMIAMDVSNSMLATDLSPNRLERTKYAVGRVIEGLDEERVGVIIFAGDAYVQLPLTSDMLTAKNFVERISTNQVTKQGTALGSAIALASSAFSSTSEGSRVVVLVSDGENHEDDALQAAQMAAAQGITIYTIGVGSPEGAPIPFEGDYIRDKEGNMVVSKLDEQTLQQVAALTGGAYVRATNASVGLEEIIDLVNKTEKAKLSIEIFEEYDEMYHIPLLASLVLLLLEFVVLPRRNRVLSRWNLFG
jgi:Ca-activated chloride channel family protein